MNFQSFYGQKIAPNSYIKVSIPDMSMLMLTNISLGPASDLDNNLKKVSNVFVYLNEYGEMDESVGKEPEENEIFLIAKLIPNEIEHLQINHIFASDKQFFVENKGDYAVYISGILHPDIEKAEEEIGLEEEEEISLNKSLEKAYDKIFKGK